MLLRVVGKHAGQDCASCAQHAPVPWRHPCTFNMESHIRELWLAQCVLEQLLAHANASACTVVHSSLRGREPPGWSPRILTCAQQPCHDIRSIVLRNSKPRAHVQCGQSISAISARQRTSGRIAPFTARTFLSVAGAQPSACGLISRGSYQCSLLASCWFPQAALSICSCSKLGAQT
jgi:hypothetical protein